MRLSFRRRLAAALLVSAVAGTTAATAGDDLVACREKGRIQVRNDNWTRVSPFLPDGGEGPAQVVSFDASPRDPNRMLMTNGTVVKLTGDGGCTWDLVAKPSAVRMPGGTTDVFTHVAFGDRTSGWAASYDDSGAFGIPHMRFLGDLSADADGPPTETRSETGLPPVGRPVALTVSRANSSVAHLLLEQPPDGSNGIEPSHQLFVTRIMNDPPVLIATGSTWRRVDAPGGFGRIEGMTEGSNGSDLWIWSKDKVAYSTGINTDDVAWTVLEDITPGTITAVDVDTSGIALVLVRTDQGTVSDMVRQGKVTRGLSLPVDPVSVTHGSILRTRAVSGDRGTWGYDNSLKRWIDITPNGVGALHNLDMGRGRVNRILLGHTNEAIWRWDMYAGESFVKRKGLTGTGTGPDVPHSLISDPYVAAPKTVTVRPGEIKDVPAEFGMPAAANPLDVYFLLDTTGSMGATIEGLTLAIKDIAVQIRQRLGREACFGLGTFKDLFPAGATEADRVFRTHVKVTCNDPNLTKMSAALANRREVYSSGGGDVPEAQTVALNQMITGDGHPNPLVLPDQDAGFHTGAYKVVVLLSDASFKQGGGYPDIGATANTLVANGIKLVNVLVITNDGDTDNARRDMTTIATATSSFAPAEGVDCDGDGQTTVYDVLPGEPLICEADGNSPNLEPLIVSLLLGVQDPGTLAVDIEDPMKAIRPPIKGATSEIFNLKRDALLTFTMPVSCRPDQVGEDLPITLRPSVRALPLPIAAKIIVQCRDPKLPPPPRKPPPPVPPLDPPPQPPVPRLPIAIAVPPPPNPAPQPPANMNLNAGFSQQEEQQLQLAAVTQGAGEETQEEDGLELAMSGLESDTSATPVAAFLAGAAIISAAAGVAYRRRLQRSTKLGVVRSY